MDPGGCRFGHYSRLRLPQVLLFGVVAIFLVPTIWQCQPAKGERSLPFNGIEP